MTAVATGVAVSVFGQAPADGEKKSKNEERSNLPRNVGSGAVVVMAAAAAARRRREKRLAAEKAAGENKG